MAVNSFSLTQTVFRIDYEDPAGGFAGWFLHVAHSHGPLFSVSGSPPSLSVSFIAHLTADPTYATTNQLDGQSSRAIAFRDEIRARLDRMFGSAGLVKWTATLVEDVTPAVIDDDYDGS